MSLAKGDFPAARMPGPSAWARTIADMEGRAVIGEDAVAEALQYRSVDERFWN